MPSSFYALIATCSSSLYPPLPIAAHLTPSHEETNQSDAPHPMAGLDSFQSSEHCGLSLLPLRPDTHFVRQQGQSSVAHSCPLFFLFFYMVGFSLMSFLSFWLNNWDRPMKPILALFFNRHYQSLHFLGILFLLMQFSVCISGWL